MDSTKIRNLFVFTIAKMREVTIHLFDVPTDVKTDRRICTMANKYQQKTL